MPRRSALVMTQIGFAGLALGLVALAPPRRGPVLLVPVAADRGAAIRLAVGEGARLLGPARGGAVLVWSDDLALAPLVRAGVLPLAAPFAACGRAPA